MKELILILALLISSNVYADTVPFIRVIDGDTIETKFPSLPVGLQKVSIRIADIDAGETNYLAKCTLEKEKGNLAAARLRKMLFGVTEIEIRAAKWDKYGGRIDAVVFANGVNLGDTLVAEGLAKVYKGSGPKPDWCK